MIFSLIHIFNFRSYSNIIFHQKSDTSIGLPAEGVEIEVYFKSHITNDWIFLTSA